MPEIPCYILALLCAVYGIFIFSGGAGTKFFLVWFAGTAFFILLGLAIRFHLFEQLPGGIRIAGGIVIGLCLLIFAAAECVICTGFGRTADAGLDYIIVLGAQMRKDGPSRVLKYRLDAAYDYLSDNPDTVCIVSGAQGWNEPCTEASGMKAYLTGRGIAAERITEEDASYNTWQNLTNCRKLVPQDCSIGIITNNFHMFRSLFIAGKCGFDDAQGLSAPSLPLYLPHNMLREFVGVMKDCVFQVEAK